MISEYPSPVRLGCSVKVSLISAAQGIVSNTETYSCTAALRKCRPRSQSGFLPNT